FASVNAQEIEFYPPNRAPVISDENPLSGTWDVPVSHSELSFRIEDADGDRMSYTVTTEPDIGSGSGNNKKDGVYTVPISGLEHDKIYRWTVEVTDGKETVEQQFSFFTEAGPPFNPFDEGWQYRKEIRIDHAQVAGDLVNFPVLVSTVDSDLRDKTQVDGDDILFMDGTGVAEKLYHEIEHYDDSSGELIAWVNIPSLSSTVDTSFYMYYGNSGCTNQQTSEMVWDSHYKGVWHMNDKTTSTIKDSTSNSNTGDKYDVNEPIEATGKIGKCQDFDGSDDVIDCGTKSNLDNTGYITFELWGKFDNMPTPSDPEYFIIARKDYAYLMSLRHDGDLRIMYWDGSTRYNGDSSFSSPITTDIWYYLGGTFDTDTNNIEFFKDDVKDSCTEWTESQSNNNGYDLDIGGFQGYSECTVDGMIDEFRISDIVRTDNWITTTYNTESSPSTFMSFGPEETGP
ncbi:MAG: DUF2341 domain-containing protein, partial [Thermoplasmatales archaeon]|nr:DUF2341 domain-containing protein [Thermoplasmatales archaeon]